MGFLYTPLEYHLACSILNLVPVLVDIDGHLSIDFMKHRMWLLRHWLPPGQ